jgi:hypothetical protein
MENSKLKAFILFILFGLMIKPKILDFTKVYRFPELAFQGTESLLSKIASFSIHLEKLVV